MKKRTAQEVGSILRKRREALGLTQEQCEVSSALVKQIERGTAPPTGRGGTRAIYLRALRWPADAMERLLQGEDPGDLHPDPTAEQVPWEELLAGQRQITVALERLADRLERDR